MRFFKFNFIFTKIVVFSDQKKIRLCLLNAYTRFIKMVKANVPKIYKIYVPSNRSTPLSKNMPLVIENSLLNYQFKDYVYFCLVYFLMKKPRMRQSKKKYKKV